MLLIGLPVAAVDCFSSCLYPCLAIWDALSPPPILETPPDPHTWISCHTCDLIQQQGNHCNRCGSVLHRRKPDSLNRTWALVIAGLILYIPANLYPVFTVISFGRGTTSTIMGGVTQLLTGNDWPLAIIVFIASIVFPLLKLLGLMGLMISVQMRSRVRLSDLTRLYRIMEFVGRWSTIDVFVAALLTALVTLGRIASVEPGIGVLAFGAVVFVTMLAVESFDPRLLWDAAEASHA